MVEGRGRFLQQLGVIGGGVLIGGGLTVGIQALRTGDIPEQIKRTELLPEIAVSDQGTFTLFLDELFQRFQDADLAVRVPADPSDLTRNIRGINFKIDKSVNGLSFVEYMLIKGDVKDVPVHGLITRRTDPGKISEFRYKFIGRRLTPSGAQLIENGNSINVAFSENSYWTQTAETMRQDYNRFSTERNMAIR